MRQKVRGFLAWCKDGYTYKVIAKLPADGRQEGWDHERVLVAVEHNRTNRTNLWVPHSELKVVPEGTKVQ